ncbi:MAG: CoA protein activase [Nitrospirae bacterium]|nr:CoA protein activase [Nitrospirota bacterium]
MKLTVPHMGLLSVAYTRVLRQHGVDMQPPPKATIKTLNLGVKYSPEFACLPFKINLGNMMEALDNGADAILMPGGYGPCRFGYYGIIQEQILREQGYKFTMSTTDNPDRLSDMIDTIRDISQIRNRYDGYSVFFLILMRMAALDKATALYHYHKPREVNRGDTDQVLKQAIEMIDLADSYTKLFRTMPEVKKMYKAIRIDKSFKPVTIGVLGEIFVVIEPFANLEIEKKLGELRVEVRRGVWLSDWLNDRFRFRPFRRNQTKYATKLAKGYLNFASGGESIETVGKTVLFQKKGVDGVLHIMPFTCMPELVASAVINRISKDREYPVLSMTFDEHVSEANIITRLEAFVDLLERRRNGSISRY